MAEARAILGVALFSFLFAGASFILAIRADENISAASSGSSEVAPSLCTAPFKVSQGENADASVSCITPPFISSGTCPSSQFLTGGTATSQTCGTPASDVSSSCVSGNFAISESSSGVLTCGTLINVRLANTFTTSSSSSVAVTGYFLPISANTNYNFIFYIIAGLSDSTEGITYTLVFPTSTGEVCEHHSLSPTSITNICESWTSSGVVILPPRLTGCLEPPSCLDIIEGTILVAGNSGNLQLFMNTENEPAGLTATITSQSYAQAVVVA